MGESHTDVPQGRCPLDHSVVAPTSAEELDVVGHDLDGTALHSVAVLEGAVLESTFDVQRLPLFDVLAGNLGELIPADTVWNCEISCPLTTRLVANRIFETGFPVLVCRSADLRVALPTRMTLLTPRIYHYYI